MDGAPERGAAPPQRHRRRSGFVGARQWRLDRFEVVGLSRERGGGPDAPAVGGGEQRFVLTKPCIALAVGHRLECAERYVDGKRELVGDGGFSPPSGRRFVARLPQRRCRARTRRTLGRMVKADGEMVASTCCRDIQEPFRLVLVRVARGIGEGGEPRGGEPATFRPDRDLRSVHAELHGRPGHVGLRAQPGEDHDRKFEPLRPVDREDAYRVVVRLGCGRLDHGRVLVGLELRPRHEVAERRATRFDERSRLVDDETQTTPVIARPPLDEGELDELALADDPFDQHVDGHVAPVRVIARQGGHARGDGMVGGDRLGRRALVIPPSAGELPLEQVDIGAREPR